MEPLQGKRIILGVSGSIAAYKSALLVRLLVKAGAEVQVIMTEAAKAFITPLTLATLSKRPALSTFVADDNGVWNNHVELGLWADALVIAPASARTLARCATALCDDLLSATYLSAKCPVFVAPAMDLDMYRHPALVENLDRLRRFGNHIIQAEHGELASGLVGEGRLAEPETIVQTLERHFSLQDVLVGKSVLITAGPTQEAIDPVRYISNHSTGKMGFALARVFALAGADVTLVCGPTYLITPEPTIRRVNVRSAQEMYEATAAAFPKAHITILNAAVADYTPAHPATEKIKKKEAEFAIELTKTVDIAATLGTLKRPDQLMMGFALETNNEHEHALGKLHRKNLDWIVLNSLRDAGAGFGHDTNKITVMDRQETVAEFGLKTKDEVAADLLSIIVQKL
ncbi:bifunctional phosphopantothenoylcysteine decarboxylase/phosphopantothenate--cysteine ligase CoaBC [Fibrella forsythiae]|uniref:Coenzyme A biosynthesis bifunctional protein CoaBC n=1 Tax=Fibrella forsythiae TaxID=2817061 RepID=A0ABS3JGF8_9BACT|nr:bifunctional phosphopantothenoylcysteine decarboxylase/phosphopantothenate--cysteine ligase CoaBC [Fibrella forsythiae]MBO0949092.1 bifunctional phosphopantothenoylcysteine decarboxylase/phosphopantothenate--cysteine ligase CoaBC [Fibrella forsythiae]